MKYLACLLISFALLLISRGMSGQSPEVTLTTGDQLRDPAVRDQIDKFYNSGTEGRFTGNAGISIYFRVFRQPENEKGAIVLSTGRTEGAVKYKELIHGLFRNGYSVYIHDHRGQGLSGRMADDPEMGHVDDFRYYVDDMKQFYDEQVSPGNHEKTFLLAHSMGGTIGMSYLEEYPDDFDAAAFSSPMLGLSAYICPLARLLAGKRPKYAPGQTGYTNDSSSFEGNSVTYSEVRYLTKIAAYEETPEAKVGGPSIQWLKESCRQMKRVFRNIGEINTPFILFTAENETVVNPRAHDKFMKKVEKNGVPGKMVSIEKAMHELLMEQDPARTKVITATLDFFSATGSVVAGE